MGRGKFKGKLTGHRHFSNSGRVPVAQLGPVLLGRMNDNLNAEEAEEEEEEEREESEEEIEEEPRSLFCKRKGPQGLIEIQNPNLAKQKNVKAKDIDMGNTTELSRRERFVILFVPQISLITALSFASRQLFFA
ncbi:hypothetical protein F3Y22_tig00111402pilonHSYRG00801 [Hibiscus syriacus]|uniref:Uncharacterized protein n=1 Tax=Hibiscus syriacus TaxID=106335 RepID=A0A6A2Y4V2_HIBSY|nr:hypothetical protein F3Y22_tig00111402pilonHSYRG00801 [Hibiscus syriacus]